MQDISDERFVSSQIANEPEGVGSILGAKKSTWSKTPSEQFSAAKKKSSL
jgi:hypothetical protein